MGSYERKRDAIHLVRERGLKYAEVRKTTGVSVNELRAALNEAGLALREGVHSVPTHTRIARGVPLMGVRRAERLGINWRKTKKITGDNPNRNQRAFVAAYYDCYGDWPDTVPDYVTKKTLVDAGIVAPSGRPYSNVDAMRRYVFSDRFALGQRQFEQKKAPSRKATPKAAEPKTPEPKAPAKPNGATRPDLSHLVSIMESASGEKYVAVPLSRVEEEMGALEAACEAEEAALRAQQVVEASGRDDFHKGAQAVVEANTAHRQKAEKNLLARFKDFLWGG